MTEQRQLQLDPSWKAQIGGEFDQPYMVELRQFLMDEKRCGKVIYPSGEMIFNAFNTTPFDKVKVVILGQDPYHGEGQAHGLSFSVKKGVRIPPSLNNIYKELKSDLGITPPSHGNLESWARQGVLLLNSVLTVQAGIAASHQGKGWENVTDAAIRKLNDECEGLVFMLWGSHAQKKASFVDKNKHLVLRAPHPSPLSAHRGFLGCKHFSQANDYLEKQGKETIDWGLLP
jgi:uracil-DNA glycosylase